MRKAIDHRLPRAGSAYLGPLARQVVPASKRPVTEFAMPRHGVQLLPGPALADMVDTDVDVATSRKSAIMPRMPTIIRFATG